MMAIGSGQLYGKGYNTNEISSVLNGGFISESQTDFIFTVIGEEFGFVGACLVVALILLIAIRCFMISLHAKTKAGEVIAAGVGAWIGFQGFLNMGVATGVMPNTGIPLPFVSYGLTSLISVYAAIGFVLNVRLQGNKYITGRV
jgi:rod shape determining protein RodA